MTPREQLQRLLDEHRTAHDPASSRREILRMFEGERLHPSMLSMPSLMHACDALGVPANGENCDRLRKALCRD